MTPTSGGSSWAGWARSSPAPSSPPPDENKEVLSAVQRLVPHYQQRFHDLPSLGQRIVEVLAQAPRELTGWGAEDAVLAAVLELAGGLEGSRAKQALVKLIGAIHQLEVQEPWLETVGDNVRLLLDGMDPGGQPWKPLSTGAQAMLAQVPFLRARFAFEGRRVTDPPIPAWDRLSAIALEPTTTDLSVLLAASHQRRDAGFFARIALAMGEQAIQPRACPRPELPAPAPDLLVPLLGADPASMTWAASIAEMSEARASQAIETMRELISPPDLSPTSVEVSALLALGTRSRDRYEALLEVLGQHPAAVVSRRVLRQLREQEGGATAARARADVAGCDLARLTPCKLPPRDTLPSPHHSSSRASCSLCEAWRLNTP